MSEVLFIALEFAPLQQTGVFRSTRFVKHLQKHGIKPVVLTINPEDATKIFNAPINQAILDDLGSAPPTYYLNDSKPIPDSETRLQRFLRLHLRCNDGFFRRLRESLEEQMETILKIHDITAIYVSLPPFGAGQLALEVARRTGLPLVVDMRDAWSEWAHRPFPSYRYYRAAVRGERELFTLASSIVTVTEELSRMFQRTHPSISSDKFCVIPNGMDTKPMQDTTCTWGDNADLFKVAYVGSYYYHPGTEIHRNKSWFRRMPHRWLNYLPVHQDWLYRSPYFFFSALDKLRQQDPASAKRFQFHQIGSTPSWLSEMAVEFGLSDQIVSHGIVPQEQVPQILQQMDACLITSIKVPAGEDFCLASKTFDYIQARKLLLGFVCNGSQKSFLKTAGGAYILDPDQTERNAKSLQRLLPRERSFQFHAAALEKYDHNETAGSLAKLLSQFSIQQNDVGCNESSASEIPCGNKPVYC